MTPVHLVRLPDLMKRGQGSPEIIVALIDGPVVLDHPRDKRKGPDIWRNQRGGSRSLPPPPALAKRHYNFKKEEQFHGATRSE